MNKIKFISPLKDYMERFVVFKESQGQYIGKLVRILREFDTFAYQYGLDEPIIKQDLIYAWRKSRITEGERTLYYKYSLWSQLARYMCHNGISCYIPRMPPCPRRDYFVPYIYTKEQINAIFNACDKLANINKCMRTSLFAMPALFRLLYSTGLRVSEATLLENKDVHLSNAYILIKKTKNKSEKLVALNKSMVNVLEQYEYYRSQIPVSGILDENRPYFIQPCGQGISTYSVYGCFRKILKECGIPFMGQNKGPRVHDIRHTYAVHSLMQMAQNGMDLYTSLPILSVSLGHKSISATEQYVRLTAVAYSDVLDKNSEFTSYIYSKIKDYGYED